MTWDCLNRMTSLTNSSTAESYDYRADGMRISKTNGTNSTLYRYDGQMGIEDVDTGSNPAVTDYALGARGIDAISKTVNGTTNVVYPLYDAHGNMVGDVSKYGSSFQVNDKRSFDAWGNIRQGAQTGDPKGRYCANLGHKQDDESGLPGSTSFASLSGAGIYMRARYYEPTSGRFISEDVKRQGINNQFYCNNDPLNQSDRSGYSEITEGYDFWAALYTVCCVTAAVNAFLNNIPICGSGLIVGTLAAFCALDCTTALADFKAALLFLNAGLSEQAEIASGLSMMSKMPDGDIVAMFVALQFTLDTAALIGALYGC